MMKIRIGDARAEGDIVNIYPGEEEAAIVAHSQGVTARAVAKNFAASGIEGRNGGAGPFDPGFDGEILY